MAEHYDIASSGQKLGMPADSLLVGTLARISHSSGQCPGHIVLRAFNRLVSLTDPNYIWDPIANATFNVIPLETGETVTLTAKEEKEA